MTQTHQKIYLVRHGETEWTIQGKHTGLTDIVLTQRGQKQAEAIGTRLKKHSFGTIVCSPLQRASQTCEHAGFLNLAHLDPDLVEWNYGEFEGLTTQEIHQETPHWNLFTHGAPGGESVVEVQKRADRVLSQIISLQEDVLLFSHGHFLRVLTMRWLLLTAQHGRLFTLFPASLSILGYEHHGHVVTLWNDTSHL